MGRGKRNWHSKGYDHIVMRGNNRQNIFVDARDMNEYYRYSSYPYYFYEKTSPYPFLCLEMLPKIKGYSLRGT